jgi:hypothetical protein
VITKATHVGEMSEKGRSEEKTPDSADSEGEEIAEKKDKKLSEARLQNQVVASLTPRQTHPSVTDRYSTVLH